MDSPPKFSEMCKVRITSPVYGDAVGLEGFVIGREWLEKGWTYKVSFPDEETATGSYDNWVLEEHLEVC